MPANQKLLRQTLRCSRQSPFGLTASRVWQAMSRSSAVRGKYSLVNQAF